MKKTSLALMVIASAWMISACSDDEEKPQAPQERCGGDTTFFAAGEIVIDDDGEELVFEFENSGELDFGRIRSSEISLGVGQLPRAEDSPGLILKFRENIDEMDLLDVIANATDQDTVTVDVVDGSSIPPGTARRSDLSIHTCGISDGTWCAQLALDSTEDRLISDDDEKVFAATGGRVELIEVDNRRSRLRLNFRVELGPNVLTTGDTSTGVIEGCIDARYERADGGMAGWQLR